jgi:hypothetical protein
MSKNLNPYDFEPLADRIRDFRKSSSESEEEEEEDINLERRGNVLW